MQRDSIASAAALLSSHLQQKQARGVHSIRLRKEVRRKLAYPLRLSIKNLADLTTSEKLLALQELEDKSQANASPAKLKTQHDPSALPANNPDADIMFVSATPKILEKQTRETLASSANDLFNRIITAMNLNRGDIYLSNASKFLPATEDQVKAPQVTETDLAICRPYLLKEVEIVRPKVIVALGESALQGLTGNQNASIENSRGQFSEINGTPLLCTCHPSFLLQPENDNPGEKRKLWEDMLLVMEKAGLPISPKQRSYFRS